MIVRFHVMIRHLRLSLFAACCVMSCLMPAQVGAEGVDFTSNGEHAAGLLEASGKPLVQARKCATNNAPQYDVRNVAGWTLNINAALLADTNSAQTARAIELLEAQLEEVIRVVPPAAVAELRKVPLWFSPPYPKFKPRAEFHPDAAWLRENGRNPDMEKGVEFSNIHIFEAESRRMPNFALHELAHAYHNRCLPGGFDNADIKAAYENARADGHYDEVEFVDAKGDKRVGRSYAMTDHREYFAECTEAFFSTNDFYPYHKDQLKQADPVGYALVEKMWTSPPALPAGTRPNVLFIALDDLNDWVGCLGGNPQARTPNVDRLAREGMLFNNAHCTAPACNPSRSSIFSGIAPWTSGLVRNQQAIRDVMPDAELLPRYFSRHGYWSAGSGKMLHYIIDPPSWDDYYPDKDRDAPFPPHMNFGKRPKSLPVGGDWQYDETDWAAFDVTDEEFGGDFLVTKWISEQLARPHEKPFFLACGIYRPHEPWFVPKKYFDMFPLEDIQIPPGYKTNDLEDVPTEGLRLARTPYFPHILKQNQWKQGLQGYLASIAYADAMLGRVLDALEKSAYRDNTIVVLWGDHGWHLGEKEHWQKFTGWRVCTRVPLIVRVPKGTPGLVKGTTAGSICSRPASLLSLYPTLTDLCGLPARPDNDSPSLVPLLKNPQAPWPHVAITHLERLGNYTISTDDWRYLHYFDGSEELYHISTDPYEWTNLAGLPDHAALLEKMRQLAPVVSPNARAAYDADVAKKEVQKKSPPLPWHKADGRQLPVSKPEGHIFDLRFYNKRPHSVKLFSVSLRNERKFYTEILPEAAISQSTRKGEVWVVTDAAGKDLGYFVAEEDNKLRALILEW